MRKAPVHALLLAAVLLPALAARAEEPMATGPGECILFANPFYHNVDCMPEENLFLMVNQGGIRAFDIHSGAQRWHHPQGANVEWGGKRIAGYSNTYLFLLDKATGRELWRCREDRFGRTDSMLLSPDGSCILACFDSDPGRMSSRLTTVLYDVESRRQLVFGNMKNAFPVAFLPDGKTALFFRMVVPTGTTSMEQWQDWPKEFLFVDLDSGRTSEAHAILEDHSSPRGTLSSSGLFAMVSPHKDGPAGLRIFDTKTGSPVRDLGDIPEPFRAPVWSADEKCLYFVTVDRQKACVLDAQTGAIQQTLSRPGHTLFSVRIQRPAEGADMILSQDEDRNFWFWPPVPDATPTRVFDGRRVAPDNVALEFQDGGYLSAYNQVSRNTALSVYRLEGMEQAGEWLLPARNRFGGGLFNRTLTHCVTRDFGEGGGRQTNQFEVYARDTATPLFSGQGDPLALSPDGRYLVIQTDGRRAVLQDLRETRTVQVFDAKVDWDTTAYAAFSDDGRRVAVNIWPALEVVDLAEDFSRRGMAPEEGRTGIDCSQNFWRGSDGGRIRFSPDGTLLLSGGYGRARLHDAGTGRLLHTFVEPGQYYETQPYTGGSFLKSLEQSARDWAGLVTDRYKRSGLIYVAFSGSGSRAVTYAAGKMIRVWDCCSGELINTIDTGMPEKRNGNWYINNHILLSGDGGYALAMNRDNFAPASLWSLADGELVRRYRFSGDASRRIALSDDAKSVYVLDKGELERWAGRN